jgi:hypothetical protein
MPSSSSFRGSRKIRVTDKSPQAANVISPERNAGTAGTWNESRGAEPGPLLNPEPLRHQALQPWLVQDVKGKFFAGEHGERGAARVGGEF